MVRFSLYGRSFTVTDDHSAVTLGSSGLRISRIVLGCMSYGSSEYQPWIVGEDEGLQQIKAA